MNIRPNVEHGIVCAMQRSYFGWPSVAKLEDGTVVVGCSGLRRAHVCPWGKVVLFYSKDGGKTYGEPQIVHDDMIDNRDAGVIALGGSKFAVTWFSTDTRMYDVNACFDNASDKKDAMEYMATWKDDTVQALSGSWTKITEDGGKTWTRPIRIPVSSPHGFVALKDGTLGYFGKSFQETLVSTRGPVFYVVSQDGGFTWQIRGEMPIPEGHTVHLHGEPHMIELKDGSILGVERHHPEAGGMDVCITRSADGGRTWTEPVRMNVNGAPAHLLRHSSGAIVMSYGYREPGYGQRAVVSYDEGQTWSDPMIIRDDGPDPDLGYPCSIELDDGSIYTVYYQKLEGQDVTSIHWSRWNLPK